MIKIIISTVASKALGKRLRRMRPVMDSVEGVVANIDNRNQFEVPVIALWVDETREPEDVRIVKHAGELDIFVGLHEELRSDFTEAQFAFSLRRLIEVAVLRASIPQKVVLAIRDAVDDWAKKYGS